MGNPSIERILELLIRQYGGQTLSPNLDPISELIKTILSQNTSDTNSRPAFAALRSTFSSWEDVMAADVSTIAEIVRAGGLEQIKADRIKRALAAINAKRGKLDLDFLKDLPVSEARIWLKELPGVGNKTANCVLLFALGQPALPVDTHIFRVSKRVGLIPQDSSLDEAHRILEDTTLERDIYQFHVLMIEHGRKVCIAQRPRCLLCVLHQICPSYPVFFGRKPQKR